MEIIQDKNFVYSAPYDIISVSDKSAIDNSPSETSNAVALIPFVSDKGRDKEFCIFRGASDYAKFEKEFGTRNMRKHGQSIYNLTETLRAGGWVIGYRITADDATYANTLVSAHVQVAEGATSVTVKLKAETLPQFTSTTTLEAVMESKITEADGFQIIPLFTIHSRGRGVYGNDFALRMTEDEVSNENSKFANYNVETIVNNSGSIEIEGPYQSTLSPDGRFNGQSIHIERIISKLSKYVIVSACEAGYEKLETILAPFAAHKNIPVSSIDIIVPDVTEGVTIDTATEGCLDLTNPYGIRLSGGTDGSWSGKFDFNSPTRSGMTKAFKDFFDGSANNDIFNFLKIAQNYVLDANYPLEVKTAMATLTKSRIDAHTYFDGGFINTVTQVVEYMNSFPANGLWNASVYGQNCMILDTDNDKEVRVTSTLLLARALPKHYATHGSHRPLAGIKYGKVLGVIPGTLYPKANDLRTEKNVLYKAKVNYIEEGEDYLMFASQQTLNSDRSKMSHVNNARMTSEMVRIILKLVRHYRYEFSEPEDIKNFEIKGNEKLIDYIPKVAKIKYAVTQTPYQKERGILSDSLYVIFKDVVEKNAVTINILGNNADLK